MSILSKKYEVYKINVNSQSRVYKTTAWETLWKPRSLFKSLVIIILYMIFIDIEHFIIYQFISSCMYNYAF
jgi:hypothetical protein